MSIETDLYTTLSTDAGVIALCSTRSYPGNAPESVTHPYIVYELDNSDRLSTIPGVGDAQRKHIRINCHADTYSEAKALVAAVIAALEGDGYQEDQYDFYDSVTQLHSSIVVWSFMAP